MVLAGRHGAVGRDSPSTPCDIADDPDDRHPRIVRFARATRDLIGPPLARTRANDCSDDDGWRGYDPAG
jgi:hypothetical protein